MAARRLLPLAALVVTSLACTDGGETQRTSPPLTADPSRPSTPVPASLVDPTPPAGSAVSTTPVTGGPPSSPPTVSTPPPGSAPTGGLGELGVLDASLDDGGTLDLLPALRLFAAGYAPVPGVTAAPEALLDGGPALRSILAHVGELSADQVAAVTPVLDQPGIPLEDARASSSPRLVKAAELVDLAVGLFSDLLDRQLPDGVEVTIVELPYANADGTHNFSSPTAFATAVPVTESNDVPYEECRVRVNADAPLGGDSVDDPAFVSSLAQEAFHCLQFGRRPFGEGVPMWAMEGAAAFAGEDFAQGSTLSTAWWGRWIGEPQRPIDRRTYDAAGFFFLLQGTVDPYRYSDAFLAEATEDSIRRRLEGTDVFDRWGSQYATEPGWGPQYAVAGVGVPATPAPQDTLTLTVDGPRVAAAGLTATTEMSATAYRFVVPGDVLVVTSGAGDRGWLRFADGTEQQLSAATRSFCLRPDGCVCPGVAPDAATADQVASTELFIGVGPSSGGGPDLAARSLQQWCNEVLVPAPPEGALDPCLAADWTSTGYVVSPVAGLDQQVTGGDGASLRLHPDHTAHLDLSATTPVAITATDAAGAVRTTTLEYRGKGDGTWSAQDGVIDIGDVPTDSFTVRVRIETSGGGVLADSTIPAGDTRMAGYADLLGTGRYRCNDVELTITHITPSVGGDAGFTFIG